MNAQQLLRKAILLKAVQFKNIEPFKDGLSGDEIDKLYESYDRWNELADPWNEIRYSGIDCNLKPQTSSRYYEVDSKAIEIDGIWVQFDYYYGGGKFGEPEEFDYIENAKIVNCEKKEVVVTEYTFS